MPRREIGRVPGPLGVNNIRTTGSSRGPLRWFCHHHLLHVVFFLFYSIKTVLLANICPFLLKRTK